MSLKNATILSMLIYIILGLASFIHLLVIYRVYRSIHYLNIPQINTPAESIPTVSVCIAVRDETMVMTQCLERVLASDYPKLEIIVMDDGSRDNTGMLIKSFAHAGVRFIDGKELPSGWLGKNYAFSILAKEAVGKYVLFVDVDTHIEVTTITRLMRYALKTKSQMVSVIPTRKHIYHASTLFATLRHFWILLRFSPKNPLGESSAWLVDRDYINDEFKNTSSLQDSMMLESSIASKLRKNHTYRLILSNSWLGVSYDKPWHSQLETSIRLLYPQGGASYAVSVFEIILLYVTLAPLILLPFDYLAIVPILLQIISGYVYTRRTWSNSAPLGAVLMPLIVLQEVFLYTTSLYRYARGTVTWKGRPIRIKNVK